MKKIILVTSILLLGFQIGFGQTNVAGIHQLVDVNKDEFSRQEKARNNQAVVNSNELVNRTQLEKLQTKYGELQDRYSTLSTAIDAAKIGIKASPIVQNIIKNQRAIVNEAGNDPVLFLIAIESEREFVVKAQRLMNYLVGLVAVIGDVNQMKASDRFLLFDHIVVELKYLDNMSRKLAMTMAFNNWQDVLRKANPFQNYVDQDKRIAKDIVRNWELF